MIKWLIRYIKYYKIKLKAEGKNCQYKALTSSFINPQNLSLGDNVHMGPRTEIDATGVVVIGNGVILAPEVCIFSRTHNFDSPDLKALPFDNKFLIDKVTIGDYVWIGKRAIILPGVTIGKAAVIGAGAVVSKDVPDYAVAVGNPAKIVRYRNQKVVESLLQEADPFVYNKFGHKKIFVQRNSIDKAPH